MKVAYLPVFLMLFFLCIGESCAKSDSVTNQREFSSKYWKTYEYQKCLADCRAITKANPKNSHNWDELGWACLATKDKVQASAAFSQAIAIDANNSEYFADRALVNSGADDSAAIVDFDKAIQLNAKSADLYYNRGMAYRRVGKFNLALKDCSRGLELNERYFGLRLLAADVYHDLGRFAEEASCLNDLVTSDVSQELKDVLYDRLSRVYIQCGDLTRALESSNIAVARDRRQKCIPFLSGTGKKLLLRAWIQINLGRISQAIGDATMATFDVATFVFFETAGILFLIQEIRISKGDFPEGALSGQ